MFVPSNIAARRAEEDRLAAARADVASRAEAAKMATFEQRSGAKINKRLVSERVEKGMRAHAADLNRRRARCVHVCACVCMCVYVYMCVCACHSVACRRCAVGFDVCLVEASLCSPPPPGFLVVSCGVVVAVCVLVAAWRPPHHPCVPLHPSHSAPSSFACLCKCVFVCEFRR